MTNPVIAPQINFISPIAEALHKRRLGISQAEASELLFGYSILYRKFQRSLRRAIDSLHEYNDRRTQEGWDKSTNSDTTEHIYDFIDTTYAASELFEFYETDIVNTIPIVSDKRASYRSEIRKLKRFSTLICNRCKHNHAFPQGMEIEYEAGPQVACFSMYRMKNKILILDEEIHRKEPCFSLNWSLRRVLTDVLIAELEASSIIKMTPDRRGEPIMSLEHRIPIYEEYISISNLSTVGVPLENRAVMLYRSAGYLLEIERISAPPFFGGNGKLRAYMDFIPPYLHYFLPYLEGLESVEIRSNQPAGEPLHLDMKIISEDVKVFDGPNTKRAPNGAT